MTLAPETPTPDPNDSAAEPQRPDLHVVRDPEVPPESDTEITGPIPVVTSDGEPVQPQAPLDVRLRELALAALRDRPRFSQRPPSFVESIEYSQKGDWAVSDKGAKRIAHGLCTVLAYALTYPLDLVLQARSKPVGFVLTVALLIAVINLI